MFQSGLNPGIIKMKVQSLRNRVNCDSPLPSMSEHFLPEQAIESFIVYSFLFSFFFPLCVFPASEGQQG